MRHDRRILKWMRTTVSDDIVRFTYTFAAPVTGKPDFEKLVKGVETRTMPGTKESVPQRDERNEWMKRAGIRAGHWGENVSHLEQKNGTIRQGCLKTFESLSVMESVNNVTALRRVVTTREALTQLFDAAYRIGTNGTTFNSTGDDALLGLHVMGIHEEDFRHMRPSEPVSLPRPLSYGGVHRLARLHLRQRNRTSRRWHTGYTMGYCHIHHQAHGERRAGQSYYNRH